MAASAGSHTLYSGCITNELWARQKTLCGGRHCRFCAAAGRSRGPPQRGGASPRYPRAGIVGEANAAEHASLFCATWAGGGWGAPTRRAGLSAPLSLVVRAPLVGRPATPAAPDRATVLRSACRVLIGATGTAPRVRVAPCGFWCYASATPCTGAAAPNVVRKPGIGVGLLLRGRRPLPLVLRPLEVPRHNGHPPKSSAVAQSCAAEQLALVARQL